MYLLDIVIIPPTRPDSGWPGLVDAALNEGLIWFTLSYLGLIGGEWALRLAGRRLPEVPAAAVRQGVGDAG